MDNKQNEEKKVGQKRSLDEQKQESKSKRRKTTKSKKKKSTPATYIVKCITHVDCYKRAESRSEIVGRYDNYEDAAYVAVTRQLGTFEPSNEEEWKTYILDKLENKGFTSYSEIWDTDFAEELYERWGEFTAHQYGEYYFISECKMSRKPRKKMPVASFLEQYNIQNSPSTQTDNNEEA